VRYVVVFKASFSRPATSAHRLSAVRSVPSNAEQLLPSVERAKRRA